MANKQDTMVEAMYHMLVKVCGEMGIAVDDPLSDKAKNRLEAKKLWEPGGALYEQSYGNPAGAAGKSEGKAPAAADKPADLTPKDAENPDFAAGVTAGVEDAQTDDLGMFGPDVVGDLPEADADADDEANSEEAEGGTATARRNKRGR